jgi:uncharacterized protein (DUF983 family)
MQDGTEPIRWRPDRSPKFPPWPLPSIPRCMWSGLRGRCPACGETKLFSGYLRVMPACAACGAPLGSYPSDDAPPYITMLVVLHLLIPIIVVLEETVEPPFWLYGVVFLPLAVILTLALLPLVKGATVGLLLRLDVQRQHDTP